MNTLSAWRSVTVVVLLAATLIGARLAENRRSDTLSRPLESIPYQIGLWTGWNGEPIDSSTLAVLSPTAYLARTYQADGVPASLFIAYYSKQRAGESMHSPRHCLPGSGWEIWDNRAIEVPVGGGRAQINAYRIQNKGSRLLVLYWYQSRKRIVGSEFLAKVFLVKDSIQDGISSGTIVRIAVPDKDNAAEQGLRFASLVMSEVQRCFGYSQ